MSVPNATTVTRPQAWGYGCALDDQLFRLAVGPGRGLRLETAPLEAPRVNTTSSPEEAAAEFGLTFARSSFDGGEGLFRAHVEGASPNRFWDSYNVQVTPAEPGEFPEVRLLHTTSRIESSTDTGLWSTYADSTASLYMAEGNTIRRTDNATAVTPTFSTDDPHNGESATAVLGVATLGDDVYAALGANGIHRKTSGAWAHWSDLQATRCWASKGRIVAAKDESLYEVTAAGAAPSPLKTLATGLTWTAVADGGSHVLAAADDGYVYAYTTDTGSLVLAAQTLFEGEQPYAVGQSQGVVAVGTRQATASGSLGRMYVGSLAENGQLVDLQLVKQWGDSTSSVEQYPRRIVGTRSALFTAVQDGTDTWLWRYDLSTAGLSRHLQVDGASGLARGLHSIGGRMFVTVDSSGMWRETEEFASEGWLMGPLGDFYSSTPKSWVGARMETGPIADGETVKLFYATNPTALSDPDAAAWVRVATRVSGSGDPGEHPLSGVVARQLSGMVRLTPSADASSTPAVRSFGYRAYPSAGDEEVIVTLPINISDQIERRGRRRIRIAGLGEEVFSALKAKEGAPVLLTLYRPDERIRGLVESVTVPVQSMSRRGSVTTIAEVRIRGRRVGSGGSTSGAGAFATLHGFGTTPTFGEVAT